MFDQPVLAPVVGWHVREVPFAVASRDPGFQLSTGQPARSAPGRPVAGLRSVKQDWVGGPSSSEPCSDSDSDSDSEFGPGTQVNPGSGVGASSGALSGAGPRDTCGDDLDSTVSFAEELLAGELHRLWLAQRPAWVDPSWYDAHIRPQVRELLLLPPGLELLTAVSVVGSGPCPASHVGEGFPAFPTLGAEPGFACDCQLVAAAAWQACESWVQAQTTRHLVDVMGEDPVVIPGDGVAPGTVDPGREEAALMLRYNVRSFANRVDTARGIEAHPNLVGLAESGACSFWTVRLLASDLSELTDEQARSITVALISKVNERIQSGARPWTGSQIRAAVKRLIARLCPNDQAGARARAWKGRRVQVWPRDHGMSVLAATISDTDAHRILRRLTKQAAELSDPERTRDQKRADVLADTLLTGPILQSRDAQGESPSPSRSPSRSPSSSSSASRSPSSSASESPSPSRSRSRSYPGPGAECADAGESVSADAITNGGCGCGCGCARDRGEDSIIPAAATSRDSGGYASAERGSASTAPSVSSTAPSTFASVGTGSGKGTVAEVCVVVKMETLLGLADDSAEIVGLGPIPAKTARELAADGQWRAWIINSAGTITATSSRTYRPGAALARLIRAREPYCRMPGCRTPASRCDLDHAIAWPEGETTVENLGPLCRRHHVLKTHYGWRLDPKPPASSRPLGAAPHSGGREPLGEDPRPSGVPLPGQDPRPSEVPLSGEAPWPGGLPLLGQDPQPNEAPLSGEAPMSGEAPRPGSAPWPNAVHRLGAVPRPGPGAAREGPGFTRQARDVAERPNTESWREGAQAPDPWCRPPGWSWRTPNGKTIDGEAAPPF